MNNQQPQRKRRYRIRWKRFLCVCFFFLALLATGIAGSIYNYLDSFHGKSTSSVSAEISDLKTIGPRMNILVLGVDDGEYGEDPDLPKRSDTIMLFSMDVSTNSASVLSIPRDTAVYIPGRQGLDKITHAHAYGGPQLVMRTVSEMLGVPVNYYVEVDFKGFEQIVDVLGGVDLYVEQNMSYEDPYADLKINLHQGFQHLNGNMAGQYVRFRHDELGDIGRVQRQQNFVQAVTAKLLQPGTVLRIPTLANAVKQNVRTDMPATQMLRVANAVKNLEQENIRTVMLPGSFGQKETYSYWIMDKEETQRLVQKMFVDPGKEWAATNAPDSAKARNQ